MFTVNEWGDLESFFYSPQFEGPLDAPLERQTEFYTAYRALVKVLPWHYVYSLIVYIG
jgi:hypothetical protein